MTIALIDNGSLEAEAHKNLRAVAAAISEQTGETVHAVSWKHSDRVAKEKLDGISATTLGPWLHQFLECGEREFIFIQFFISEQGAIGSALNADLEAIRKEYGPFEFVVTVGLASTSALTDIAADRIRTAATPLGKPAVIVVDHGGPSPASARLRNRIAQTLKLALGSSVADLAAASMESPEGDQYAFNKPLLADILKTPGFNAGNVVIAPLFLSPGRHAGPNGDLRKIAHAAELESKGLSCTFADLIGTHPFAVEALAKALKNTLRLTPIL